MPLTELDARWTPIISAFAAVARPIIRSVYDSDSCIVSTRIAIDVFQEFNLLARPLVARMHAFNSAMACCLAEAREDNDAATYERWHHERGARAVHVGYADGHPVPRGYWAGHLVAVVERQVLVDASADQASRPHLGISLPGVIAEPVTPQFLAGMDGLAGRLSNGCGVIYQSFPRERSYRGADFWKGSRASRRVADTIITAMNRRLETLSAA